MASSTGHSKLALKRSGGGGGGGGRGTRLILHDIVGLSSSRLDAVCRCRRSSYLHPGHTPPGGN